MVERIDARDVLDANAWTARPFLGRVLGYFVRTGPNSWDDYEYVRADEGSIEVHPRLRIQMERRGPDFRMRLSGRVVRVRWMPGPSDPTDAALWTLTQQREYFIHTCVQEYQEAPGLGAAAAIATRLTK
ncbi:hypothetical protein ACFL5O_06195 [Myxococcota bacterium]